MDLLQTFTDWNSTRQEPFTQHRWSNTAFEQPVHCITIPWGPSWVLQGEVTAFNLDQCKVNESQLYNCSYGGSPEWKCCMEHWLGSLSTLCHKAILEWGWAWYHGLSTLRSQLSAKGSIGK